MSTLLRQAMPYRYDDVIEALRQHGPLSVSQIALYLGKGTDMTRYQVMAAWNDDAIQMVEGWPRRWSL